MVHVRKYTEVLCHMSWIRLSLSNGIHILRVVRVRCERLMESKSWSWMRCFFVFVLCSRARLCEHRDMHMRVMHITCRLHTSSPLRNVLCVYSVCVFNACMPIRTQIRNYWGHIRNFVMRSEIRNNYEFFVMVGSSVKTLKLAISGFWIQTLHMYTYTSSKFQFLHFRTPSKLLHTVQYRNKH